MNIEVKHNPLVLIAQRLIKVTNAKAAREKLDRFCITKDDRGYRLRYIPDNVNNTMELGARWSYPLNMAIRCLQDAGLYVKELKWRSNPLLKQIREKQY